MTALESAAAWAAGIGLLPGLYAYGLYPVLLRVISWMRPRRESDPDPDPWPMISISIPAFNEEHSIGELLDCVLATDYPADRRQVLVVSDASTDATDDIVRSYEAHGVELLRMPRRGGKTAAENAARERLRGDIVINTDASVRLDRNALKPLVRRFADPTVGVASGRDVSVTRLQRTSNYGEAGYVGYEMWVRDLETQVDGIVGASGCLYAIRRELHDNLVPEALSRDFSASLMARENGYRSVTVNDAICYVPRTESLRREYTRKVRTMTRGLETLFFKRHLMNPFRFGVFAWMLISHKLVRWLAPLGLALTVAGVAALAITQTWSRVLLLAVAGFAVLAWTGWIWSPGRRVPRVFAVPAYVALGLLAALTAWPKAARGELNPVWEPTRRT